MGGQAWLQVAAAPWRPAFRLIPRCAPVDPRRKGPRPEPTTGKGFTILLVAGVTYLFINFVLTRVVKRLEHWLSPHLRDAPVSAMPVAALAH